MNSIPQIIAKCDIFGWPINLNLNTNSKYQTMLGGVISLITLFILIGYTATTGVGYLNYRLTQVNSYEEYLSQIPTFTLQNENFMFMFNVSDFKQPELDIKVIHNNTQIPLVQCSTSHLQSFNKSVGDFNISSLLCPGVDYSVSVGTNSAFQIQILSCTNISSWGANCQENAQNQSSITFYRTNNIINPTLNGIQIQSYIEQTIVISQNQVPIRTTLQFKQTQILDFNSQFKIVGVINPYMNTYTYSNSFQIREILKESNVIFTLDVQSSQFSTSFKREYSTITDFLSKLGGLYSTVVGLFGIIFRYYNRQQFYVELSNKLYDFPSEQLNLDVQDHIRYHQHLKTQLDKTDERAVSENTNLKENVNQILDQYKVINRKYQFKSRKHFLLTMFQSNMQNKRYIFMNLRLFLSYICTRSITQDNSQLFLINKAIARVTKEMDIFSILERLSQIEKMKKILLDNDQLTLFNYSPKLIIGLNDQEEIHDFTQYQNNNIIKKRESIIDLAKDINRQMKNSYRSQKQLNIETIYTAYRQVTENKHKISRFHRSINKKLRQYLGDTLKAIFLASQLIRFEFMGDMHQSESVDIILESAVAQKPSSIAIHTRLTSRENK